MKVWLPLGAGFQQPTLSVAPWTEPFPKDPVGHLSVWSTPAPRETIIFSFEKQTLGALAYSQRLLQGILPTPGSPGDTMGRP